MHISFFLVKVEFITGALKEDFIKGTYRIRPFYLSFFGLSFVSDMVLIVYMLAFLWYFTVNLSAGSTGSELFT